MQIIQKWLPGIVLGLLVIVFDFTVRVLSGSTLDKADEITTNAFEYSQPTHLAISNEQFNQSYQFLLDVRKQEEQQAQQKEKPKNNQSQGKNEDKQTATVAKQKVTNERIQVRTDDGLLTLKGIFYAGAYFAVVEVVNDSGSQAQTEQVRAQQMIKNYQVENIAQTELVLRDQYSGQLHVLRLFKQD